MKNLFISPHLDDAVLSCGGLISKEVRINNTQVYVLNLFSGLPEKNSLSEAAKQFHQSCGLGSNAIEIRKQEELAASKNLGYTPLFLDLFESQYRLNKFGQHVYDSFDEVFKGNAEKESTLISYLEENMEKIIKAHYFDTIFIPLTIGNHVDHVIARRAVENISQRNFPKEKIKFYEDMPYACRHQQLTNPSYLENLTSILELLPSIDFERKLHTIEKYASQVSMLWRSKEQISEDYREYSFLISQKPGMYYERYWQKKD